MEKVRRTVEYDKEGNKTRISTQVFIVESTIEGNIQDEKTAAIKKIMAIVDISSEGKSHSDIRKAVLGACNDMARAYEDMLENLLSKGA